MSIDQGSILQGRYVVVSSRFEGSIQKQIQSFGVVPVVVELLEYGQDCTTNDLVPYISLGIGELELRESVDRLIS